MGHAPQLIVHNRHQAIEGGGLALGELPEERANIRTFVGHDVRKVCLQATRPAVNYGINLPYLAGGATTVSAPVWRTEPDRARTSPNQMNEAPPPAAPRAPSQ